MGFVRNVVAVLLTTTASIPLGLLSSVILARRLSVADRGEYALLVTFSVLICVLSQLGWPDAAIHRVRRHRVPPGRAFATGLWANALICTLVFALVLAVQPWLAPTVLHGVPGQLYDLAALGGCLAIFGEFLRGSARAIDRFDLHNWYGFLQSAGLLVALTAALVLGDGGLRGALLATVGVQATLCTAFLAVMARTSGVEPVLDTAEARAHLRYGLAIYPQGLVNQLHERLDMFVLAALGVGSVQIAFYAVAISVIGPLRFLPDAISTVLLPHLAVESDERAAEVTAGVARQAALQMTAISLAIAPVGIVFLPLLFGASYAESIVPFLLLLPGIVALSVSRVLARYFATVARQGVLLGARAIALALNVVLCLALIPGLGIRGAALASLVTYAIEAALVTWAFLADAKLSARLAFAPRRSDFEPYIDRARRIFG
jgi:O-antigen/teichoic acid export membrane protein